MRCSGFGLQAQPVPEEQHSPGTAGEIKAIANQVGWDKMKENNGWSVKTEFDEATSVCWARRSCPPGCQALGHRPKVEEEQLSGARSFSP